MTPFGRINKHFTATEVEDGAELENATSITQYYPNDDILAMYKGAVVKHIIITDGIIDEIATKSGIYMRGGGIPYSTLNEIQLFKEIVE